jgi:hypothetical protein
MTISLDFWQLTPLPPPRNRTAAMKLKQTFRNSTDKPQFITLELSTARYRLDPNEELVLFYEPEREPLEIEFIIDGDGLELLVWTAESEMFFPDGRPGPQDYDLGRRIQLEKSRS